METAVRIGGVVVGVCLGAWGGLPLLVQALVILMALDIASGVAVAADKRALSSSTMRHGVTKKAFTLLVVGGAAVLEVTLERRFAVPDLMLTDAVAGFFLATEFLSLLENGASLGVPVPKRLRDALIQLQRWGDGGPPPAP